MAQPPLFRVRRKKDTYYVQTEEEMKTQLLEAGLSDAVFEPGDGRVIGGKEMERLCRTLAALEDSLVALERRGISLRAHALRQDPSAAGCRSTTSSSATRSTGSPPARGLDDFLAQRGAGRSARS